jgi:hypothetical protein
MRAMMAHFAPGPEIEPPEISEGLYTENTAPDPYPIEDGSWAMTLEEIGAVLGIGKEQVRRIENRALEKIRRSGARKTLIELLDVRPLKVEVSRTPLPDQVVPPSCGRCGVGLIMWKTDKEPPPCPFCDWRIEG